MLSTLLSSSALSNIRSLIPPDYLGGINESRFVDGIFWTKPLDPAICGPFKNEVALNEGMICRIGQLTDEPHTVLIRSMVCQILTDHCTVFTHGDIQPKNIMVERINKVDDGNARFKVTLIDFELSGWYPEYWEYATAVFAARWQPQWHELMQKASILESYPLPYLLMSMIRNIIFVWAMKCPSSRHIASSRNMTRICLHLMGVWIIPSVLVIILLTYDIWLWAPVMCWPSVAGWMTCVVGARVPSYLVDARAWGDLTNQMLQEASSID